LDGMIVSFSNLSFAGLEEVDTHQGHEIGYFRDMKSVAFRIEQFEVELVVEYLGDFGILSSIQAKLGVIQACAETNKGMRCNPFVYSFLNSLTHFPKERPCFVYYSNLRFRTFFVRRTF
jgi:hypothetical protein